MTRENVKKNMDIISAFAEGKVIQILNERDNWVDLTEREGLPMGTLEDVPDMFRIKPEPKYRPFKDTEECWNEMRKHYPFGWVKSKDGSTINKFMFIDSLTNDEVTIRTSVRFTYSELVKYYIFTDGVPFGVKVEED